MLLARVLLDMARATGDVPLVLWANLLRAVPDEGINVADLPAATRTSRRAVKVWCGRERMGWFTVSGGTMTLTAAGRRARDEWSAAVAATEQAWSDGIAEAAALRAALETLVAHLDLELPHYPMTYGTADVRVAGGGAVPAQPGPPRIPAHGADWDPVVRTDPAAVRDLPLLALLSQGLMAFTVDYEERGPVAFAVADLLHRAMPATSVPLAALPAVLGVTGSGKTALERHGVVQVTGSGREKVATLTPAGVRIRDAHRPVVEQVTADWRARYGPATVDGLMAVLAAVDARLAPSVPDHVLVRYAAGGGFTDVS